MVENGIKDRVEIGESTDICQHCGEEKNSKNFMPSSGYLWVKGHVNLCYDCLATIINGDELNEVDRMCQFANMAFFPSEWRKIWLKDKTVGAFRKYAQSYNDINYTKLDWKTQSEKLIKIAQQGLIETELEELEPNFRMELQRKWGENTPENQLLELESFFQETLAEMNAKSQVDIDLIKKLARVAVKLNADLSNGLIDKNTVDLYQKLVTQVSNTLQKKENAGLTSVSELIAYIEKKGYRAQYYDNVNRDEIDLMIRNIQNYLKDLVESDPHIREKLELKKDSQARLASFKTKGEGAE